MRNAVALLAFTLAACAADETPLEATNVVFNRPAPGMQMSAGYLTLTNHTSEQVTLTRAESPQFETVGLHQTVIADGVAKMIALDELKVPPKQSVHLKPGGRHLMLMGPKGDLDTVTVDFFAGGDMVLTVSASTKD